MGRDSALIFVLRAIATTSLLALIFVFVPYRWMNDIHHWLGLGDLPAEPIVGYLARSVSAFYALVGGLLMLLSFDVVRYRSILVYVGVGLFVFGGLLAFIDWHEGLPFFWKVWEGPFVSLIGLVVWILSRRLTREGEA